MGYEIVIIQNRFSNNEKKVYDTVLESEINVNLVISLIKRLDDLEQQKNDMEDL